jgi:NADH-quinone oxidoreductase subunit A
VAEPSLWPLALYFASVVAMVVAILVLSSLIGEKSPMKRATGEPFESGVVHIGSAQNPVSVEFFLVAMFFVIFDLETVFIFAWAVAFHELGVFGYLAISFFIFILVVALIYEWKSGALDWGQKIRTNPPPSYKLERVQD